DTAVDGVVVEDLKDGEFEGVVHQKSKSKWIGLGPVVGKVLQVLRLSAGEVECCEKVFEEKGIQALKCLINCVFTSMAAPKAFLDNDEVDALIRILNLVQVKQLNLDTPFVMLRLLFIVTAYSPGLFQSLAKKVETGDALRLRSLKLLVNLTMDGEDGSGLGLVCRYWEFQNWKVAKEELELRSRIRRKRRL
ncbi:hypothetical protein HDU76_004422, partial [Blyttiomyces sp. JEL0837]